MIELSRSQRFAPPCQFEEHIFKLIALRIKIYAGSKEAFYARFVEFGTKTGVRAQPFFFAAYKKWGGKAKFRARIRAAIRKRIKEAFNG